MFAKAFPSGLLLLLAPVLAAAQAAAAPLRLGYSDWPGWAAWQVAIDKGWLERAGLHVKFEWFDYSAAMDAFAAGRIVARPGIRSINDPKTQDDAVRIMAARVGLAPRQYQGLLAGTHLIDIAEGRKVLVKAAGPGSLYGSSQNADDFNVRNAIYQQPQKIERYIDSALTAAQL